MTQYANQSMDYMDLNTLTTMLFRKKWLILGFGLACFILATTFSMLKPANYQSSTLILIQPKQLNYSNKKNDSTLDVTNIPSENATTQMALIKSNMILDPIIKSLNLNISIKPNEFFNKNNQRIHLSNWQIPDKYLEKELILKILENNIFQITDKRNNLLVEGKLNENVIQSPYQIKIDNISAESGTEFSIIKHPESAAFIHLKKKLAISNLTSSNEGNPASSDILQISLNGTNPILIADILNKIAITLQEKNIARKRYEIDKRLVLLNKQIGITQQSLQFYETKLNRYRIKSGKIDIKLHTGYLMNHVSEIDKEIDAMYLKKINLLQNYTANHPDVILLNEKIQSLKKRRVHLFSQLKKLPSQDQVAMSLSREINIKNTLYINLLHQIQELNIIKSDIMSDVSILTPAKKADAAIPIKLNVIALLSFFIGIILGCIWVIIVTTIQKKVSHPLWIEEKWGIKHIANIPFSKEQAAAFSRYKAKKMNSLPVLSSYSFNDNTLQHFYMLRNFLLKNNNENNIISIIGLPKKTGKAFISVNLALLLARLGHNTILIDADINHGHLQDYFITKPSEGLIEIIQKGVAIEDAIIKTRYSEHLSFLPSGKITDHRHDLFTSKQYQALIEKLSKAFDYILINAGDNYIAANVANSLNLIVMADNKHKTIDFDRLIKNIHLLEIKLHGAIYNMVSHISLKAI